jgi:hypothetical protein
MKGSCMEKPAIVGRDDPLLEADRPADDAALIARSRAEPEAFAAIFDRHATEIHRYASRRLGSALAEDVVGETLPTDPRLLRAWIYRHPDDGGPKSDGQAWTNIGDILREMLVPPKLAAALFKVAATIPGAAVVPHAANAVGLRGVAVSLSGAELIFDPKTYQLIGEGAVLTKPVAGQGPAGTVVASTAQLQARVVSSLPDIPPSEVYKAGGVTY